jgi:hypothetical protein
LNEDIWLMTIFVCTFLLPLLVWLFAVLAIFDLRETSNASCVIMYCNYVL